MGTFPYCFVQTHKTGYGDIPIAIRKGVNTVVSTETTRDQVMNVTETFGRFLISYKDEPFKYRDTVIDVRITDATVGVNGNMVDVNETSGGTTTVLVRGIVNVEEVPLTIPLEYHRTTEFLYWLSGSLMEKIEVEAESLARGENPACDIERPLEFNATISLIDSNGQRNLGGWMGDTDLTGVACWTSRYGTWWLPTAITRRHVITAYHINGRNTLVAGNKIHWVGSDNVLVERTVVRGIQIANTDLFVATLDSDLPATVLPFCVIGPDYIEQVAPSLASTPVLGSFIRARSSNIANFGGFVLATQVVISGDDCALRGDVTAPHLSSIGLYGDSGCAVFTTVNKHPLLMGIFSNGMMGPSVSFYREALQSLVSAEGASLSEPVGFILNN